MSRLIADLLFRLGLWLVKRTHGVIVFTDGSVAVPSRRGGRVGITVDGSGGGGGSAAP